MTNDYFNYPSPMRYILMTCLFCTYFGTLHAAQNQISQDTCIIPSAFTPNDDGQNDEFVIHCIANDHTNESELLIFTEWGERIANFKPYRNDWRGVTRDKPLPDGTYYYIFRLNPRSEIRRGFVEIFR